MTPSDLVGLAGVLFGLGVVCLARSLRSRRPSLAAITASIQGEPEASRDADGAEPRPGERIGRLLERETAVVAGWLGVDRPGAPGWRRSLAAAAAVNETSLADLATRVVLAASIALLAVPLGWAAVLTLVVPAGGGASLVLVVLSTLVAVPLAAAAPVMAAVRRAAGRRCHLAVVTGSFLDLVELSLAGGMGVESALLAAAAVGTDWGSRRIARALTVARDTGVPSWVALGDLGELLDVAPLREVAAALRLAGTEGARIRQSLHARAVALRHHQQADAERAAHTATERLFFPGALLLVGFLVFIGYPAFTRILGGM